MATMICSLCHRTGIHWVGRLDSLAAHTKCPHCGGVNCQEGELDPKNCDRADCPQGADFDPVVCSAQCPYDKGA